MKTALTDVLYDSMDPHYLAMLACYLVVGIISMTLMSFITKSRP